VIVKGTAHVLSANADILDAQEAPLLPWTATLKPLYVRVIAMEISGRRFKFGPEPDRESTSLDDCRATWQRNRHTTSAAKCFRCRDFRPPTLSACGRQVCIFLRVYQSFSDPHVTPGRAVVVGRNRHRRGE